MTDKQIADNADMIVAGYAFSVKGDYVEVVDLSDIEKVLTIQDDVIAESLMTDEEDAKVLSFYLRNKDILEESLYA